MYPQSDYRKVFVMQCAIYRLVYESKCFLVLFLSDRWRKICTFYVVNVVNIVFVLSLQLIIYDF